MVKVINNLPEEHDVVVDGLENKLSSSGDKALTVEKMKDKLNDRYQRILDHKEEDKSGDLVGDVALLTMRPFGKHDKKLNACDKCGFLKHKTQDCNRLTGRHGRNDQRIKCWYCGEYGHKVNSCEKLKEKADRGEYANTAFESVRGGVIMMVSLNHCRLESRKGFLDMSCIKGN
jgi:hypothetical protein